MITIDNYFQAINKISFSDAPEALFKGHEFLMEATDNGKDLDTYQEDEQIKKTIELYLDKLNEFILKSEDTNETNSVKPAKKTGKKSSSTQRSSKKEKQKTQKEGNGESSSPAHRIYFTERIPEELRFIRRFVNMDGKTKTKEELLRFINSLQKAILEKRIRKTSDRAKEILFIQTSLIGIYNTMKQSIKIQLKGQTKELFSKLAGEEKILPSINFIKRYIGLNGKSGVKEKANNLLIQINRAMDNGKISDDDPYFSKINEIRKILKAFTSAGQDEKTLRIEQTELNGLQGILGCGCQTVNGLGAVPAVMNSMDFTKLEFDTIGFTGKWRKLIGDPSRNFTAMVFGKPKFGKSYLCVEFAGYLARNHGKVLYVAKEEGLDYTLQEKLKDKDVAHPNLFVASEIPGNLAQYDFIFLDSVNKLGLKPEDLNQLKAVNPAKSFIFIFQATKDGRFRGANTFQHDVDVVVEVPEKGKAVQMGRFNQGGEMDIFPSRQVV